MGPYCMYCDKRCFVERRLPFQTSTLLMATCDLGMAHDRRETGHDFKSAVNPNGALAIYEADAARQRAVAMASPAARAALESARSLVTRLEGQVAHLAENMAAAAKLLPELEDCECNEDEGQCTFCRVGALLSTARFLDPTGMDRLFDALGLAVVGNG